MQALDTLYLLQDHDRPWCRVRAQQMIAVTAQFGGGGLESEEYSDIIMRILDQPRLDRDADDLAVKQQLVTAALALAGHI